MISVTLSVIIIYICCLIGLLWAFFNFLQVKAVDLQKGASGEYVTLTNEGGRNKIDFMIDIGEYIARGANAFLFQEYKIMAVFCAVFFVLIKVTRSSLIYILISF